MGESAVRACVLCDWEGNRRSRVTDNSGLSTNGLMADDGKMSTPTPEVP